MLKTLTIQNLATIEHLCVEFHGGLNVLTGETGAGKSILIGGLELALGERSTSEAIRSGENFAVAEAVFDAAIPKAAAKLITQELEVELASEENLVLRRELSRSGRSRCFINGQMVAAAGLKRVGELLVDLHGQHEHQSLFHAATHRAGLDAFANHDELLAAYEQCWREVTRLRRRQRELREAAHDFERRLDYLNYQLEEIEKVAPAPGEMAALEQDEKRLAHAEALARAAAEGYAILYEGLADEQPSLLAQLREAEKRVEEIAEVDAGFAASIGKIEEIRAALDDLALTLRDYADTVQADPQRLNETISRREAIKRLARKHGGGEQQLLAAWETMKQERDQMRHDDAERLEIDAKLVRADSELQTAGQKLRQSRLKAAEKMRKLVVAVMRELAMEKAQFDILLEPLQEAGADGLDRVEFLLAANPGLPPAPLRKVASGGELSRVMLALKSTLAARDAIPTLVFDEIDAGISGETTLRVGKVMEKLAESHQILCITHHAAIAARARNHAFVKKIIRHDTTYTEVETLTGQAHVDELARMIAGDTPTPAAKELARQLMG